MQPLNRFGLVGEADFLTNCLLYELLVAKPYGEYDPFDSLVGKLRPFWRVQIKTTANLSRHKAYHVGVARRPRIRGVRCTAVYTPDEVDFICIYLVPEDTWYIIPIEVVDGRLALNIHAHDHPKIGPWLPYREAWHLLAQTGERIVLPAPEPNALTPRRRKFNGRRKNTNGAAQPDPFALTTTRVYTNPNINGTPEARPSNAEDTFEAPDVSQ